MNRGRQITSFHTHTPSLYLGALPDPLNYSATYTPRFISRSLQRIRNFSRLVQRRNGAVVTKPWNWKTMCSITWRTTTATDIIKILICFLILESRSRFLERISRDALSRDISVQILAKLVRRNLNLSFGAGDQAALLRFDSLSLQFRLFVQYYLITWSLTMNGLRSLLVRWSDDYRLRAQLFAMMHGHLVLCNVSKNLRRAS